MQAHVSQAVIARFNRAIQYAVTSRSIASADGNWMPV